MSLWMRSLPHPLLANVNDMSIKEMRMQAQKFKLMESCFIAIGITVGLHAVAPGSNPVLTSGARFSKVPKLFGAFSGVTIPFVSQERRGFKSSNSLS